LRDPFHEKKKRPKAPKALEDLVSSLDPAIKEMIDAWNAEEVAELEPELFKQRKRVADAERKLLTKVTKKAQDDVRIGNNKVQQIKGWLDDFKRKTLEPRDERIFPSGMRPCWWWKTASASSSRCVTSAVWRACRLPATMPRTAS